MEYGRFLIFFILIFSFLGIGQTLGLKWPKFPGDIVIRKKGFTFAFPIGSAIIFSIIITIIFNLF